MRQPGSTVMHTTLIRESIIAPPSRAARRARLGVLAIAFFALHGAVQWRDGNAENLLWACHVADLCVGVGLLAARPALAAAGVLMLAVGIPLWLINLAFGGAFYPTSLLTHLGGFAIGVAGLRGGRFPANAWILAVAIVGGLLVASRALALPAANVNLAFHAWKNVVPNFTDPGHHLLALLALWMVALWTVQQGLSRCYMTAASAGSGSSPS